jgi:protein-tyrosine phosphatase/nicotinamidase-related amidase
MARSILITQCLQRDFVDPIGPHDPLPNLLHVGHTEAARLLGAEPAVGPLAQLMNWARSQTAEDLRIIHIRDWHDPNDPRQHDHLRAFGDHCVRDGEGAKLVLQMDDRRSANEHIVDSITLNDFVDTDLETLIKPASGQPHDAAARVGVIGVWTDAKVSFLLYELKTRLGMNQLATCSALTASASRAQHFNALSQLHKLLGIEQFDSVAEFADWLAPGAHLSLPENVTGFQPAIEGLTLNGDSMVADRAIIGHLFRDSATVRFTPLTGGFSEAAVFRADAEDALGYHQAPSVVKLGPNGPIAQERVAFERIEEILGNNAPRVRGFVDLGARAGIKYSFAAMGAGTVRTLKEMFDEDVPVDVLEDVLRDALEEVLAPLYAAATYERLPLFEHYQFSPQWSSAVSENVAALGYDPAARELDFAGGLTVGNPCRLYDEFLPNASLPDNEFHYVSYVHGDLNAANILVDARSNVWVIDFFHAAQGHVLKDLAKLENDVLFILTPITNHDELREALAITTSLRDVTDLGAPLTDMLARLATPAIRRAWRIIVLLRSIGGKLCREDRNPQQLNIARLRYAVHTLGFDESSPLQKQWALATSGALADDVAASVRREHVLRVDWLPSQFTDPGRIGLTICPGRRDRGRSLTEDLETLRAGGATAVVCLLTDTELEWAGVANLRSAAISQGLTWRRLAIPDQGVPGLIDAQQLVLECRDLLDAGEHIVLVCMGGLGRSGTIAACAMVEAGLDAHTAIEQVRLIRGSRAVETFAQEHFVRDYEAARRTRSTAWR